MTFKLEIECDNAAFGDTEALRRIEIACILRQAAMKLERGENSSATLRDGNGNSVGIYAIVP